MKSATQVTKSLMQRIYALDQISRGGLEDRIEATRAEQAAIAAALDLRSVSKLVFLFELKPRSRGRFYLVGQLEAQATQTCVVTLEPVEARISETVDMELWPADQVTPAGAVTPGAEVEITLEGPEPYTGNSIDLGQIAYELFASALDPYPRKPGAEFTWAESGGATQQGKESPFQALRALKNS